MNAEGRSSLRATLDAACAEEGCSAKELTVLAPANDPFRVDTPAGHRDGEWLAVQLGDRRIHLRGLQYIVIGETKPDGKPYTNTDGDWEWLQSKAGKAARWLGYVPFDRILDARNGEPVVREFERPEPEPYYSVGVEVEIPDASEIEPRAWVGDFKSVQPNRLVLFGEKTSLQDVLAPLASRYQADRYLPTGEASDTMIYQLAESGAQDGRRMVVFYLSDCDPAGWQMAVSVARKLQALKAVGPAARLRAAHDRAHARPGARVWLAIHAAEGDRATGGRLDGRDGRRADRDRRARHAAPRPAAPDRSRGAEAVLRPRSRREGPGG